MMIHNTFHRVENAKAKQHGAGEKLCRPKEMRPLCGAPEQEQSHQHEDIGRAVEDTVPKRVEPHVLDRVHGVPTAEHMMPLQNLVKNDPVKKPAEPEPEEHSCGGRERSLRRGRFFHGATGDGSIADRMVRLVVRIFRGGMKVLSEERSCTALN
jgi:hypothetical protein